MSITTFTITVVSTASGNKYAIDGVQQDSVLLSRGGTYKFDQSDSSNENHPLRFSTTDNGTHRGGSEYTSGVTTNGTPGNSGAYTQIVTSDSLPTILHYQCSNHAYMGNAVQCNTAFDRTALAIIDGGNFDTSSSTASRTNSYDGGNFDS